MNCGHCGSAHNLIEIARGQYDKDRDYDEDMRQHIEWYTVAVVKQCPQCRELILYTYHDGTYQDDDYRPNVLYPRHRDLSALPFKVRLEYEKAQKVKSIDSAFYALGIRRVLEAVCTDKNIAGRNLESRLKKLVENDLLPDIFADMGHYLRDIGNAGAHADSIEVEKSDAVAATDFVEAILEYLYISPAKLKLVTDELAARKAADKGGTVYE